MASIFAIPMLKNLDKRWLALGLLCLWELMIVLDTTIVNVALPSIRDSLGFTETALVWVINAYMLTFSGFLLMGGRLGDLYGHKKLFLIGLALFTLASLACGLSPNQEALIIARAIQGFGGAIVSAIALSLIMGLFKEPAEQAKAMGFLGFVAAGGGSIGVFLGGLLTGALDWRWTFLVNVPVGIMVFTLCYFLLPRSVVPPEKPRLDIAGALTITASLMLAIYAIVDGNQAGWVSLQTLGLLAAAIILFAVFLIIEMRVRQPLVPLRFFRSANISLVSIIGVLWSAAMFAWFFLGALYMQSVLGYDPLSVGLAFLPSNLIMGAFSVGISAWIVMRYGVKKPIAIGMFLIAVGLALFARLPVEGQFVRDILPPMLILGLGMGLAMNPLFLAAMQGLPEHETGLASGVINTAFMMGGALGLAILASLAGWETQSLVASGMVEKSALTGGYTLAFMVGAIFALIAMTTALFVKEGEVKMGGVH